VLGIGNSKCWYCLPLSFLLPPPRNRPCGRPNAALLCDIAAARFPHGWTGWLRRNWSHALSGVDNWSEHKPPLGPLERQRDVPRRRVASMKIDESTELKGNKYARTKQNDGMGRASLAVRSTNIAEGKSRERSSSRPRSCPPTCSSGPAECTPDRGRSRSRISARSGLMLWGQRCGPEFR